MNFSDLDHEDVWIRAGKTAVAAFVGVFILAFGNLFNVFTNQGPDALKSALAALIGAALSAAITAGWNYLLQANT